MIYDLNNTYYNGLIVPIEFWKPITDEMVPGIKPIYYISNIGNIYNSELGRYSSMKVKNDDYARIILRSKSGKQISTTIHRLVCMAFNGMPPGPGYDVDHKNCDRSCSIENNLEWVTKKENSIRAHKNNLCQVGENNYRSIMTNNEVEEICKMLSNGIPIKKIECIMEERIYPRVYTKGSLSSIIIQIYRHQIWKNISKNYTFPEYQIIGHRKFNKDQIILIKEALSKKLSYDYIIDNVLKINCTDYERKRLKENLYNIKIGRSYSDINI